ncbi:MAG TPA: hypothetical protein VF056_07875 [Thermoleophilaceae bacterium]
MLERPVPRGVQPARDGGVTLEERLNLVLDAARATGSAECPVCHARMTRTSADTGSDGACCSRCGSELT